MGVTSWVPMVAVEKHRCGLAPDEGKSMKTSSAGYKELHRAQDRWQDDG